MIISCQVTKCERYNLSESNGSAEPSEEDIEYTNELKQGLKLIEINLIDHIIVANSTAISMKKAGKYKSF